MIPIKQKTYIDVFYTRRYHKYPYERRYYDMKEIDARGLSCPEPLMLTAEALKNTDGPVRVLVSEAHQRTNVEKYAKDHGKKATTTEKGSEFEIIIE